MKINSSPSTARTVNLHLLRLSSSYIPSLFLPPYIYILFSISFTSSLYVKSTHSLCCLYLSWHWIYLSREWIVWMYYKWEVSVLFIQYWVNGKVLDASPFPLVTGEEKKRETILTECWKAAYLPLTVLQIYIPGRHFKVLVHFDAISLSERVDGIHVQEIRTGHIFIPQCYTLCCLEHCEWLVLSLFCLIIKVFN